MKRSLPRIPFSTPFSSSKKLLETRIRGILAGPQTRPPLPLLALAFCFFSVNLVSCQPAQSEDGPDSPSTPIPDNSPFAPQSSGIDRPADELNSLLLDYYRDFFFRGRPGNLYFAADMPGQPQGGDILLDPLEYIDSTQVYETEGVLYRIGMAQYIGPDSLLDDNWLHWPDDYVVLYRGWNGQFQDVAGSVSTSARLENASPEETSVTRETADYNSYFEGDYTIWQPLEDSWVQQAWDGLTTTSHNSASEDVFYPYILDVTRTDMVTYRGIRAGQSRAEVLAAYPELRDIDGVIFWGLETENDQRVYTKLLQKALKF